MSDDKAVTVTSTIGDMPGIPAKYNNKILEKCPVISRKKNVSTVDFATWFRQHPRILNDRVLNCIRLQQLEHDYAGGFGLTLTLQMAKCSETGETYRINGNHTSWLMLNKRIPIGSVEIVIYACETYADVVELWGYLDQAAGARNSNEVLKAKLSTATEFTGIPFKLLKSLRPAICYALYGHNYAHTLTHADKADEVLEHFAFAEFINNIIPSKDVFCKPGVFYAIWVTYNQDKVKAEKFWNEVVKANHVNPLAGSRLLNVFLLLENSNSQKSLQWFTLSNYCLRAWTLWKHSRYVTSLRLGDTEKGVLGLSRYITHTSGKITDFNPDPAFTEKVRQRKIEKQLQEQENS